MFIISERQLIDSEMIADILWSTRNRAPEANFTQHHSASNFVIKENDKAFIQTKNSSLLNPLSNFLVYKRKDAKIAWPSAVSLLCNK